MRIVSIDVGHKNLAWIIVEYNINFVYDNTISKEKNKDVLFKQFVYFRDSGVIIDWRRSDLKCDSTSIKSISHTMMHYIQSELLSKYLVNEEVFYVIESQLRESTYNSSLENTIKTVLSCSTLPKLTLGIMTLTSLFKFRSTMDLFDNIAQQTLRPLLFEMPSGLAHNMKSASQDRVVWLVKNIEKVSPELLGKGFIPVNLISWRNWLLEEPKLPDLCDCLIQFLSLFGDFSRKSEVIKMIIQTLIKKDSLIYKKRKMFHEDLPISLSINP